MHSHGITAPTDASEHLSELPAAAQDLLANARQLRMDSLADLDPAGLTFASEEGAGGTYCFDISTEEARALAMIFDDAGWENSLIEPTTVGYANSEGLGLNLWPMLPHGVPAFVGG